jgi:tetratricopeptide (TPR) repeat protein
LAESKQAESRQAPEPTSAERTDKPEGAEKVVEAPDDKAEQRKPSPVSVRLTRASLAVSEGDIEEARGLYESVLEDDSDHLRAQFGLLKVRQRDGAAANSLEEQARSLLEHPKLDAQTAYNIGLFARAKLDAEGLAESFFDVVRTKDPAFAEQNGL